MRCAYKYCNTDTMSEYIVYCSARCNSLDHGIPWVDEEIPELEEEDAETEGVTVRN